MNFQMIASKRLNTIKSAKYLCQQYQISFDKWLDLDFLIRENLKRLNEGKKVEDDIATMVFEKSKLRHYMVETDSRLHELLEEIQKTEQNGIAD